MKHYFCCAYRTILCLFLGYPLSICCWLQTEKSTSKWNGGGVIWEDFVVSSNENWEEPNNNGVSHFSAIFTHTHFCPSQILLQSFLNTLTVAKAVSYWSKNCFYCVTPMSMWLSLICSVFPSSFLGIVASSRWEGSKWIGKLTLTNHLNFPKFVEFEGNLFTLFDGVNGVKFHAILFFRKFFQLTSYNSLILVNMPNSNRIHSL